MKRMLLVSVGLFVAGCGASTDTEVQIPVGDVSKVTPTIRAACGTRATDETLAILIAAVEIDHDNGLTKADELAAASSDCAQKTTGTAGCQTCMEAIIDQVYGPS